MTRYSITKSVESGDTSIESTSILSVYMTGAFSPHYLLRLRIIDMIKY